MMEYVPAAEMIGSSRRTSVAASNVSVPTPSRDLSFRRGAYTKNILRLEQSAEVMSAGGSDIGEEIRRMNEASRQNSIQSDSRPLEILTKSRTNSYGSKKNNSIIDARAGTFSPAGIVTSPVGSVHSRTSIHRHISTTSQSSKLAHMLESSFEDRPLELSLTADRPLELSLAADRPLEMSHPGRPLDISLDRQPSQSSYAQGDDGAHRLSTQTMTSPTSAVFISHVDAQEQEEHGQVTPPIRPGSTDTYQQAQTAFMDFDGVHCSPDMEEFVQLDQDGNEVRRISGRSSGTISARVPSMLLAPQVPLGAPPPQEGMVFYPAPVPRMLNLPKRLSQLPAANVQAKRRSQVMSQMYAPTRNSAAWLSQRHDAGIRQSQMVDNPEPLDNRRSQFLSNRQSQMMDNTQSLNNRQSQMMDITQSLNNRQSQMMDNTQSYNRQENPRAALNERLSVVNFANVPPQLRASVFFEHQTVVHDVNVKSESAVATLDSILAASATAPVSAFTDHPYVGDISKTAYAAEKPNRRSTANDLRLSTIGPNRKSMLKRASSANALDSTYTMLEPQGIDARKSQVSLAATDIDSKRVSRMPLSGDIVEEPEEDEVEGLPRAEFQLNGTPIDDEQDEEEFHDEFEDDEDIDPNFAQPTTLLAELQVRKAQLKSRTRTAATAFPNGMHSTLLELDAVAAIDKKKRSHQRVALAWEDPNARRDDDPDAEDEEVPLGMLFPSKNGLLHRKMGDTGDWDRPLGLMEKREMEDHEPLSSRRSRLRGEPIRPRQMQYIDQRQASGQTEVEGIEGETIDDETLQQRLRRISTKDALDGAIADIVPKDGSRPLSTFTDDVIGQLNINDGKKSPAPEDLENETLGQRRARLQREKEAARPALQTRTSMSNLLTANPVGQRQTSREHVSTRGTLLFANEQAQAEHKRNMLASNMRSSSYNRPLATSQSAANLVSPGYNAFGMQTSASTPMFGMQQGYFPQQPAMANPYAYGMLTGQSQMYPAYGMPGPGMMYPGMGYNAVQPPTLQQRSAIDQWRLNIAQ